MDNVEQWKPHIIIDPADYDLERENAALLARAELAEKERDAYKAALEKIDAIRNKIIGYQAVHWSRDIYPLVAALREVGFEGESYEVARAKAEAECWGLVNETA